MSERFDFDTDDAPWVQTLVKRVYAAGQSGDQDEADRLLTYGRAEGGETFSRIVDQLLEGLAARDAALGSGRAMKPQEVSAAAPDQLVCDFCTGLDPIAYDEVAEFGISAPGGSFLFGRPLLRLPALQGTDRRCRLEGPA
ncbi:hypothetical protein OG905_00970 [Streptomyces sp. NBC_00322]|uniref:hypothetical protein n=1 Tax=Streptomyces sp. NBC_00322 TaxID=2975712 RepID=UPI002E2C4811|nr:hypothetical protein [Streptomyces sp. NBC_00322]